MNRTINRDLKTKENPASSNLYKKACGGFGTFVGKNPRIGPELGRSLFCNCDVVLAKFGKLANIHKIAMESNLRQFSSTELTNKTGDVLAAAAQRPVAIARHGKARFVVLSTEQFERLQHGIDTRRSVHVSDLNDAEAEAMIEALQESIDND